VEAVTSQRPAPTLRQQRLARVLRQLREAAGLLQSAVADALAVDPSTVHRWENPALKPLPSRLKLARLLQLYGVDSEQRARVLALAQGADGHGWWQPYVGDLSPALLSLIEVEAEAGAALTFDVTRVPGLLQTPQYARALIRGELPMTSDDVEQRVKVRTERQLVLDRTRPLELWAILDEAALHRMVGGPHITVQIIPYAAGAYPGMDGSFVILDLPEAEVPGVVYVDGLAGQLFMEDEPDLARFRQVFDRLRAAALSPEASAALVATLMRDIEGEAG
jgi:transcriptional regulator with XRE-family HTH domain